MDKDLQFDIYLFIVIVYIDLFIKIVFYRSLYIYIYIYIYYIDLFIFTMFVKQSVQITRSHTVDQQQHES